MKTNFEHYKEPIKMTLFEKSILECAIAHGYEWIARNETIDKLLIICDEKPTKEDDSEWYVSVHSERMGHIELFNDKFLFIKGEDEEPVHIPTLLKECEVMW